MARPIRLRHETFPLIAMPRGGGFVLGLTISDGYNPATVDHWMFDLAAKHGAPPRTRFWTADVTPSGQDITLSYPLDTLSDEDDSEVTIDTVSALGLCEWGLTAYNAENEILWRAQGDVDFDAIRGGLEGTSAGIGSPITISLGGETTFTITILGNAEAGGLDAAGLAALIHAGTAKATPADNDEFALVDSAASNGFKKVLWSAIKATLNTYFDTIYTTTSAVATQISNAISALGLGDAATKNVGTSAGTVAAGDHLHDERYYTETEVDTLLGGKLATTLKGSANGLAELDSGGLVPSAQLPSYVDDVIEAADFASLPGTGATGKIYVTLDDGKTYRWSGSAYVEISASLALGETSSTAYRGDRGKTAYDHSQATGNPHGTTPGDIGAATSAQGSAADAAKAKTDFLTVTANTDLDAIRVRVDDLDAAVILKGIWDASAGTFPGAGAAQAGWSYIVSVAGTVGGVAFAVNDRLIAIADNASTSTYASNWHKADYTDQVLTVAGKTGTVTLEQADISGLTAADVADFAGVDVSAGGAVAVLDSGVFKILGTGTTNHTGFNGIGNWYGSIAIFQVGVGIIAQFGAVSGGNGMVVNTGVLNLNDVFLIRKAGDVLQQGLDAASPAAQIYRGAGALFGDTDGGDITIQGGAPAGAGVRGDVKLHGGNRAAYDASPSATTIRDILISHGLMDPS